MRAHLSLSITSIWESYVTTTVRITLGQEDESDIYIYIYITEAGAAKAGVRAVAHLQEVVLVL